MLWNRKSSCLKCVFRFKVNLTSERLNSDWFSLNGPLVASQTLLMESGSCRRGTWPSEGSEVPWTWSSLNEKSVFIGCFLCFRCLWTLQRTRVTTITPKILWGGRTSSSNFQQWAWIAEQLEGGTRWGRASCDLSSMWYCLGLNLQLRRRPLLTCCDVIVWGRSHLLPHASQCKRLLRCGTVWKLEWLFFCGVIKVPPPVNPSGSGFANVRWRIWILSNDRFKLLIVFYLCISETVWSVSAESAVLPFPVA